MSYRSLIELLEDLGPSGELARVDVEVDPRFEMAEITARVARRGGPALLFGRPRGHDMPVLTNLLGTPERICRALGVDGVNELAQRLAVLLAPGESEGWFDRLKGAPHEALLRKHSPRTIKTGPCQQVVRLGRDVDLGELPVLHSWPGEASPVITAGQLLMLDVRDGSRMVGRFDLAPLDGNRLAVGWAAHDAPAQSLAEAPKAQQPIPVAVVLGGDPASMLATSVALPRGVDAFALAGVLRDKPMELVKCRSHDLEVPAEAEIVIEGHVNPGEKPEAIGPLCTPSGFYSPARMAPTIHVSVVTHRANPIYPALVFGRPPHEACAMAVAIRRVLLPLLRMAIPELVDYSLPEFGAARHWAAVSIRKGYAGQARKVASALWGAETLMFSKLLVVVDESVDVHNPAEVLRAMAENFDPSRDVLMQPGVPDPWDPAGSPGRLSCRMATDATRKLPEECGGQVATAAESNAEVRALIEEQWGQYGLG